MGQYEIAHQEHLHYGEVLTAWFLRYDNGEPSLVFTVEVDDEVHFYGTAEAATLDDVRLRYKTLTTEQWSAQLDSGEAHKTLRYFLYGEEGNNA